MKIFLVTSSLFKLYHQEVGTHELETVFVQNTITHVFLSEIAKIEFASTVWKKVRTKQITTTQAETLIECFEQDFSKYTFISTDNIILKQAWQLISKYGETGLRTLDGIQLATAVSLQSQVQTFFTSDKLLKTLLDLEALPTD